MCNAILAKIHSSALLFLQICRLGIHDSQKSLSFGISYATQYSNIAESFKYRTWSIYAPLKTPLYTMSESETTSTSNWNVMRDCEAERRGAHWEKVTYTSLPFLALKGLKPLFYHSKSNSIYLHTYTHSHYNA